MWSRLPCIVAGHLIDHHHRKTIHTAQRVRIGGKPHCAAVLTVIRQSAQAEASIGGRPQCAVVLTVIRQSAQVEAKGSPIWDAINTVTILFCTIDREIFRIVMGMGDPLASASSKGELYGVC